MEAITFRIPKENPNYEIICNYLYNLQFLFLTYGCPRTFFDFYYISIPIREDGIYWGGEMIAVLKINPTLYSLLDLDLEDFEYKNNKDN